MVRPFTSLAALAAIGLLAGCGGGGSTPSGSQPAPNGSAPPTNQSGKTRASISIVIRASKASTSAKVKRATAGTRKRDYVAPTTQGIIAEFAGSDSASDITYQGYTLAANATESSTSPASCGATADDGSFTCTLYFALAPNITYATTLTAYDAAQSGTSPQPATGSSALSTATQNETISANSSNTFTFTLSGIVEGFSITPQYVGVAGTGGSGTLTGLFQALDADNNPIDVYDGSTAFVYGPQPDPSASPATPGGPFIAASFPVVASDENEACVQAAPTSRRRAHQRAAVDGAPCLTTTSMAVTDPANETVSYTYNGEGYSGDGTTTNPPYYGEITLTPPTNYGGNVSNGNAASLFIVPFFGFVDQTSSYESGTAAVTFTDSGQSINGYGTQYSPPSGAPTDGSGYTVDASTCISDGVVSSVSTPAYTPGVGISFSITSGDVAASCSITLSDNGTNAGADTATISVTNTVPSDAQTLTVPSPGATHTPDARRR
jgi:hypothetical protein